MHSDRSANMKEQKTNVMRLLEQKKIKYTPHEYPHGDDAVDGATVAAICGLDPSQVFKTLVARGASKSIYVFDVPVTGELDLKKAAKAAGEKSIAMIHVSEINALTGYIRGGCSPIGMKKQFRTVIHESAKSYENIMFSGGQLGSQIKMSPTDLAAIVGAEFADIIM